MFIKVIPREEPPKPPPIKSIEFGEETETFVVAKPSDSCVRLDFPHDGFYIWNGGLDEPHMTIDGLIEMLKTLKESL